MTRRQNWKTGKWLFGVVKSDGYRFMCARKRNHCAFLPPVGNYKNEYLQLEFFKRKANVHTEGSDHYDYKYKLAERFQSRRGTICIINGKYLQARKLRLK